MYQVYVLKSEKYNRFYIGLTDDLARRFKEHNSGQVKSTKYYKPYKIIHTENRPDRTKARKREKWLKSGCGREWIKNNYLGL
jgi:putative endonuclease